MQDPLARLRAGFRRGRPEDDRNGIDGLPADCSWETMRQVYQEQAARGVPEAIRGLELIEQGRWPSSGRRRDP